MRFWDLLFSKYASPFSLLDQLIANCDFFEWIIEFIDSVNDDKMTEIWLHKSFDEEYSAFKERVLKNTFGGDEASDEQVETTINDSKNILDNFIL